MLQRQTQQQEKILIQYLLGLVPHGRDFEVPQTIFALDDDGMHNIRLASKLQASYLHDLIQVKYLDDDNILVLITLSQSDTNELFELEFWKVYSNKLITYPIPEKIKHVCREKIETQS